ncbi:MAG: hypothetical protein EKK55_12435 [Rhodocyclaceae bacterium]|nr:MAG: hypothetical protein EKK55_12435 [Rhodocyclaceae bacterium]
MSPRDEALARLERHTGMDCEAVGDAALMAKAADLLDEVHTVTVQRAKRKRCTVTIHDMAVSVAFDDTGRARVPAYVADELMKFGSDFTVVETAPAVEPEWPDTAVETDTIDIVFDAFPNGEKAPGFVEVEDATGRSIDIGEWLQREDGTIALRLRRMNHLALAEDCERWRQAAEANLARLDAANERADGAELAVQEGSEIIAELQAEIARMEASLTAAREVSDQQIRRAKLTDREICGLLCMTIAMPLSIDELDGAETALDIARRIVAGVKAEFATFSAKVEELKAEVSRMEGVRSGLLADMRGISDRARIDSGALAAAAEVAGVKLPEHGRTPEWVRRLFTERVRELRLTDAEVRKLLASIAYPLGIDDAIEEDTATGIASRIVAGVQSRYYRHITDDTARGAVLALAVGLHRMTISDAGMRARSGADRHAERLKATLAGWEPSNRVFDALVKKLVEVVLEEHEAREIKVFDRDSEAFDLRGAMAGLIAEMEHPRLNDVMSALGMPPPDYTSYPVERLFAVLAKAVRLQAQLFDEWKERGKSAEVRVEELTAKLRELTAQTPATGPCDEHAAPATRHDIFAPAPDDAPEASVEYMGHGRVTGRVVTGDFGAGPGVKVTEEDGGTVFLGASAIFRITPRAGRKLTGERFDRVMVDDYRRDGARFDGWNDAVAEFDAQPQPQASPEEPTAEDSGASVPSGGFVFVDDAELKSEVEQWVAKHGSSEVDVVCVEPTNSAVTLGDRDQFGEAPALFFAAALGVRQPTRWRAEAVFVTGPRWCRSTTLYVSVPAASASGGMTPKSSGGGWGREPKPEPVTAAGLEATIDAAISEIAKWRLETAGEFTKAIMGTLTNERRIRISGERADALYSALREVPRGGALITRIACLDLAPGRPRGEREVRIEVEALVSPGVRVGHPSRYTWEAFTMTRIVDSTGKIESPIPF